MTQANDTGNSARVSIRNVPGFTVRIEDELRTQLEDAAKRHQQSLQKEVIARLKRSFVHEPCDQAAYIVNTAHTHRYLHE